MKPPSATSPAAPHHQERNQRGEWLAMIATSSRPATVTAVDSPIGPRRNGTSTSLLPRASSPPPTRAIRNGNDATIVVAPMIAARTATWRMPPAYRRVAASGSAPRPTRSKITTTNHHSPNAVKAPAYPSAVSTTAPARMPHATSPPSSSAAPVRPFDDGAPTLNTDAPPTGCESADTMRHVTV